MYNLIHKWVYIEREILAFFEKRTQKVPFFPFILFPFVLSFVRLISFPFVLCGSIDTAFLQYVCFIHIYVDVQYVCVCVYIYESESMHFFHTI